MGYTENNMIDGDNGSDCFSPNHNPDRCPRCKQEQQEAENQALREKEHEESRKEEQDGSEQPRRKRKRRIDGINKTHVWHGGCQQEAKVKQQHEISEGT
jgi:hypothetical protein